MLRSSWILACGAVAVGVLAACGDDADTTASAAATTSTASTTTGGGGDNTTTTTGAGGDTTTTTTTTTTGAGGAGGDATTTSAGGAGGAGGDATTTGSGMDVPVNGCTLAMAKEVISKLVDMTPGNKPWTIGYQNCVKVKPATELVWKGNFATHPLSGGVSPTVDAASPVSKAKPAQGELHVSGITEGAYPFFCTNHPSTMQGVVYVIP